MKTISKMCWKELNNNQRTRKAMPLFSLGLWRIAFFGKGTFFFTITLHDCENINSEIQVMSPLRIFHLYGALDCSSCCPIWKTSAWTPFCNLIVEVVHQCEVQDYSDEFQSLSFTATSSEGLAIQGYSKVWIHENISRVKWRYWETVYVFRNCNLRHS